MIEITKYHQSKKGIWDNFVRQTKNYHFFFLRDYMEYHADRFTDHSLLFFDKDELVAVLPGNIFEKALISHGGLTFGGMLTNSKMKIEHLLELFENLKRYLINLGIEKLFYKAMPHMYHAIAAEEDLYALFTLDAKLVRRDVSSTIHLQNKLSFSGGKKNGIAKAKKKDIVIEKSNDFLQFNQILSERLLTKYDAKPTHSVSEMILLSTLFPENIQLFGAFKDKKMIAGVIVYLTNTVVHTQYMATTDFGRETGALDLLLSVLIHDFFIEKKYFDFGISTEQQGRYLNTGLVGQKELFGARTTVYDTYELQLSN